jgi:hypothetical protein
MMHVVLRRLFTLASTLSLLRATLSLVLWLRSYGHAFGMSDVTAWDAQGNRVPIGFVEGLGFGGAPHQTVVPRVDLYNWKLEWLAGRLVWNSRAEYINHGLYPNATFSLYAEEHRGFELWGYPLSPLEMQRQRETLDDRFQQIQTMGGWTHVGFAYWAGPSHNSLLHGDEGTDTSCDAIIPIWFPTLCLLILPGLWAVRLGLAFRRRAVGCCVACG